MLINVKMPTIVGILTFISMINALFDSFKARYIFIFLIFFLSASEISCSVEHEKSFITLRPGRKLQRQVFSYQGPFHRSDQQTNLQLMFTVGLIQLPVCKFSDPIHHVQNPIMTQIQILQKLGIRCQETQTCEFIFRKFKCFELWSTA